MNASLAVELNAWLKGDLGAFWAWLGSPAAAPWLGVIALAVLGLGYLRGDYAHCWATVVRGVLAATFAICITDPLASRVLKPIFAEPRPCTIGLTDAPASLGCGSGYGMPSAHAANSAAIASAIGSPALAVVACVVGVSRVVDGQHWPADVVAGWALGGAVGLLIRQMVAAAWEWLAAKA